jgi:transcriptional regulator with XRE-family HTH domain
MAAKRSGRPGKPTIRGAEAEAIRVEIERICRDRFENNRTSMGETIGVSQPTVSDWINGVTVPHLPNLRKLARFSDIIAAELTRGALEVSRGALRALDVATAYHPDKWDEPTIVKAKALEAKGERHSPQGWAAKLDELYRAHGKR